MIGFRLRVLDVRERETDPPSFLGIVEGFPQILTHGTSAGEAEADLVRALSDHFERLQDRETTLIQLDDLPTVRVARLWLSFSPMQPEWANLFRGRCDKEGRRYLGGTREACWSGCSCPPPE
jgi:hypothetical protein